MEGLEQTINYGLVLQKFPEPRQASRGTVHAMTPLRAPEDSKRFFFREKRSKKASSVGSR
jgi:hypothetical protein